MAETEDLTIRFAADADLEFCVRQDRGVDAKLLARKLEWGEIIVAEWDGKPVGYLRLEHLWSKLPYIGLIVVDEVVRKLGIGRSMVSFLEGYLKENGKDCLWSSSEVDAPGPQAWHRKLGFVEAGFLAGANYRGVGEIFFRKSLD